MFFRFAAFAKLAYDMSDLGLCQFENGTPLVATLESLKISDASETRATAAEAAAAAAAAEKGKVRTHR